jgi:16S rRNA processing protein RimM
VERASDDPSRFEVGASLHVAGDAVEVVESKLAGGRQVVRVDAGLKRGDVLEVPVESLPEPHAGSYYIFDLIGLSIESSDGTPAGRVRSVTPGVANDVVELESGMLLPLVAACVLDVDLERKVMVVERAFLTDG